MCIRDSLERILHLGDEIVCNSALADLKNGLRRIRKAAQIGPLFARYHPFHSLILSKNLVIAAARWLTRFF